MTCLSVCAQQYYVRGEVKDESGNALQNVNILQHKTGYVFRSGATGNFGILSQQQKDTFSFSLDGYCTQRLFANADNYLSVNLKRLSANASSVRKGKLSSYTKI